MRDTLRSSMSELMQFANNETNQVSVKKYTYFEIYVYFFYIKELLEK